MSTDEDNDKRKPKVMDPLLEALDKLGCGSNFLWIIFIFTLTPTVFNGMHSMSYIFIADVSVSLSGSTFRFHIGFPDHAISSKILQCRHLYKYKQKISRRVLYFCNLYNTYVICIFASPNFLYIRKNLIIVNTIACYYYNLIIVL